MMTSTMISGLFSDDVDHDDDDGQVMDNKVNLENKRLFSNPLPMRWIMLMMICSYSFYDDADAFWL